jgi:acyl-CoA thioester hydrolase
VARTFRTQVRVAYADTDQMGVVYHANYLIWFERGRTEAMRELGLPYAALEARGVVLPVVEAGVRFRGPARYDDLLVVETVIEGLGRSRIAFRYAIRRDGPDEPVLVEGYTEHAFLTRDGRVARVPDEARALIEPVVDQGGPRPRRPQGRRRRESAG